MLRERRESHLRNERRGPEGERGVALRFQAERVSSGVLSHFARSLGAIDLATGVEVVERKSSSGPVKAVPLSELIHRSCVPPFTLLSSQAKATPSDAPGMNMYEDHIGPIYRSRKNIVPS